MKLHRFYIKENIDSKTEIEISDQNLIHQIKNVFRMKEGDKVIFFNGDGTDYLCQIIAESKKHKAERQDLGIRFKIIEEIENKFEPKTKVNLYFSLIRKDNVEMIIQKCTEIGVSEFHPIISERSERKGFNMERAEKIAIEASEQSGRGELPKIFEPKELSEVLNEFHNEDVVVFDPSGSAFNASCCTSHVSSVFIGPEGGFTEKELKMFKAKDAKIYSLGKQILRAETACIAVSAITLM